MEWINIKDRLPEIHKAVLFYVPMPGDKGNAYQKTGFWNGEQCCYYGMVHEESILHGIASHWMALPESPEDS